MQYDPMASFLIVVNQLKNVQLGKLSIHVFDKYVCRQDGKSAEQLFLEERKRLISSLPSIFNADVSGFDDAVRWALDWVNAYDNSFSFFDVLSELFDYDYSKAQQLFIRFLNSHMSPIIGNKNGGVCSLGGDASLRNANNVTYWTYMYKMYRYVFLDSSQTCCSLQICQSQGNCPRKCFETPLLNLYITRTKCMFHQFYRMWGLSRRTVYKGSDYSPPLVKRITIRRFILCLRECIKGVARKTKKR